MMVYNRMYVARPILQLDSRVAKLENARSCMIGQQHLQCWRDDNSRPQNEYDVGMSVIIEHKQ
jgi:hypothetical protein